jgi:hypothetical protein
MHARNNFIVLSVFPGAHDRALLYHTLLVFHRLQIGVISYCVNPIAVASHRRLGEFMHACNNFIVL